MPAPGWRGLCNATRRIRTNGAKLEPGLGKGHGCEAMKAPVGLSSGSAVCDSRWRGFAPTSSSLPYSVPAGFGADALQQEHYRSPTNVRTLAPNSNDQRQDIIMAMASCLLCYIRLFFHGRVWYTRLGSINRNLLCQLYRYIT